MNKPLLMCFMILLGGCVGHYQQPAPDKPHATLEAKWGDNDFISGALQGYWAYHDVHCQDTDETGVLGVVSSSSPEKNRFLIQPDRRIYLTALSAGGIKKEGVGGEYFYKNCMNVSSFIPQAGVSYQVTQKAPKSGCSLEIVEARSGKAPPTLVVEQVTKECGF